MASISTERRNDLPDDDFALPGRRFPIDTAARARNALARGAQALDDGSITRHDFAMILAKVRRRYPDIQVSPDVLARAGLRR